MDELIRSAGSFRRLMEEYWTGQLTPEQERVIEDSQPKATLASYKPLERQRIGFDWDALSLKDDRGAKAGRNRALEALYEDRGGVGSMCPAGGCNCFEGSMCGCACHAGVAQ